MIPKIVGHRLIYLDGARLAEVRHAFDLTMRDAADHLGVTAATICGWEHNDFFPSESHLSALSELYGTALETMGAIVSEDLLS